MEQLQIRCAQMFCSRGEREMIRIPAPPRTVASWWAAIEEEREKLGPSSRPWQAAAVLCGNAHEGWFRIDPQWEPSDRKLFERDRFLCQAPGCSKRDELHAAVGGSLHEPLAPGH